MSFAGLTRMPVTLLLRDDTAGAEDDHGNPVPGTPVPYETTGYITYPTRSEQDGPETQTETFTLFLHPYVPVTGWDQVVVMGATYQLLGPPSPQVRALTGRVHHLEATVAATDPVRAPMEVVV